MLGRLLSARLARNGSDPGVLHCGPLRICGLAARHGYPELAPETGLLRFLGRGTASAGCSER